MHALDRELTFPNGIALSPDERTLYVANSDPKRPIWMAYSLDEHGDVLSKRVFADASDLVSDKSPGLPDGMRVDRRWHSVRECAGRYPGDEQHRQAAGSDSDGHRRLPTVHLAMKGALCI